MTNSLNNTVTVIDGATKTTAIIPAGTYPISVAVNPVTNKVYVANLNSSNVTVITEQEVQPIPLVASITPLANNLATSTAPAFNFSATSTYSPIKSPVQNLYYALDTWQNGWQRAGGSGASYTGTTSSLLPGTHVIYAFATDGEDASSINTGYGASPIIGGITAYLFDVVPLPAVPVIASPGNNAANLPVSVTLKIDHAAGAAGYHWQVSTSSLFTGNVVDDSTSGTGDTSQVVALIRGTRYHWRVQAFNLAGSSSYAGPDSFTTIVAPPSVPKLVSPLDTTGVPRRTTFVWDSSANAVRHHLQVAKSDSLDSLGGFSAASVVFDTTMSDTSKKLLTPLAASTKYYWHVSAIDTGGASPYSTIEPFTTGTGIDAIDGIGGIPRAFALYQNYPNPFNPSTTIRFDLKEASMVTLDLYDILGRRVREWSYGTMAAGTYERNIDFSNYSSGVYFYRIVATGGDGQRFVSIKKALLMK